LKEQKPGERPVPWNDFINLPLSETYKTMMLLTGKFVPMNALLSVS